MRDFYIAIVSVKNMIIEKNEYVRCVSARDLTPVLLL